MITVAEYNHADQIQPYEPLWDRLISRTPDSCLSHTWDWIKAQSASADTKLRILVAFLGGRPFGVLPLKVETRSTTLGTLRCLTGIGEPWFPFAGPLGPNTTAMLTAAFRHIHRTRRDWDMVEFRLADGRESLRQRVANTFRLVGWSCDTEAMPDTVEICPESVMTPEFKRRFDAGTHPSTQRTRFERQRPGSPAQDFSAIITNCLSLVEELRGPTESKPFRVLHESALSAGQTDWCLLCEEGVPLAAAINLVTYDGIRTLALVGRNEAARFALFRQMLENGLWRGDGPYVFPVADVPPSEQATHATRLGFRYTHVSPWAIRARWLRFRERIQSPRRIPVAVTPTEEAPAPRMLTLYSP